MVWLVTLSGHCIVMFTGHAEETMFQQYVTGIQKEFIFLKKIISVSLFCMGGIDGQEKIHTRGFLYSKVRFIGWRVNCIFFIF